MKITISYNAEPTTLLEFAAAFKALPIGSTWFCGWLGHVPNLSGEKTSDNKIRLEVGQYFSTIISVQMYWYAYHNEKQAQKLMNRIKRVLDGKGMGLTEQYQRGATLIK